MRFGKKRTFNVKLESAEQLPSLLGAARPTPAETEAAPAPGRVPAGKLGFTVETLTPEVIQRMRLSVENGLRVTEVAGDGPARGKLVPNQDIILEITYPGERRPVKSVAELKAVVDGLKPGDYLGLHVMRIFANGSQTQAVTLRVPND
jgi:S1-C subfamily serine protease